MPTISIETWSSPQDVLRTSQKARTMTGHIMPGQIQTGRSVKHSGSSDVLITGIGSDAEDPAERWIRKTGSGSSMQEVTAAHNHAPFKVFSDLRAEK